MKNLFPVLLVLFLLVAGAFAVAAWIVLRSGSWGWAGQAVGPILVYEVDASSAPDQGPADMAAVIEAVNRRVNPGGARNARVRQLGDRRIEIGVYGSDPQVAAQVKRMLESAGTIELRILANDRDHKGLIEQARRQEDADSVRDDAGALRAWWVPAQPGTESGFNHPEIATRPRKREDGVTLEVLVVKDEYDVTGAYLNRTVAGVDQRGSPCVTFMFNAAGAKLFGGLTGDNLPDPVQNLARKLGIILNGRLYSAPTIRSTIYDRGEITGSFTRQEVEDLVNVLNAGSLPAPLKLVEERSAPGP